MLSHQWGGTKVRLQDFQGGKYICHFLKIENMKTGRTFWDFCSENADILIIAFVVIVMFASLTITSIFQK